MREKRIEIPKNKKKRKITDKDIIIIDNINKGMSQSEISRELNISREAVSKKVIKQFNSKELANAIIKLKEAKKATPEQIQIIADYYGIDINEIDER